VPEAQGDGYEIRIKAVSWGEGEGVKGGGETERERERVSGIKNG
jgi:hypothetical protein